MGKLLDALQRHGERARAQKDAQQQKWQEQQEKAASEKDAVKAGYHLEAFRAWQRGDAIYVFTTGQSIANRDYEQRQINAEVNSIARVGWVISNTATKTGYVIFTFVRPS